MRHQIYGCIKNKIKKWLLILCPMIIFFACSDGTPTAEDRFSEAGTFLYNSPKPRLDSGATHHRDEPLVTANLQGSSPHHLTSSGLLIGRDGYVLQLIRRNGGPYPRASHNQFIREATNSELNEYYAFEVCPYREGRMIRESGQCWNPFRGADGRKFIMNRFVLNRLSDPLLVLIALFERGVNLTAETIDWVRDHKAQSVAVTTAAVLAIPTAKYSGHLMQRWSEKTITRYLSSPEFLSTWRRLNGPYVPVPSLSQNPRAALQAVSASLSVPPRVGPSTGVGKAVGTVSSRAPVTLARGVMVVRRAYRESMTLPTKALQGAATFVRRGLYIAAGLAIGYLGLSHRDRSRVHQRAEQLKGWSLKGANKTLMMAHDVLQRSPSEERGGDHISPRDEEDPDAHSDSPRGHQRIQWVYGASPEFISRWTYQLNKGILLSPSYGAQNQRWAELVSTDAEDPRYHQGRWLAVGVREVLAVLGSSLASFSYNYPMDLAYVCWQDLIGRDHVQSNTPEDKSENLSNCVSVLR